MEHVIDSTATTMSVAPAIGNCEEVKMRKAEDNFTDVSNKSTDLEKGYSYSSDNILINGGKKQRFSSPKKMKEKRFHERERSKNIYHTSQVPEKVQENCMVPDTVKEKIPKVPKLDLTTFTNPEHNNNNTKQKDEDTYTIQMADSKHVQIQKLEVKIQDLQKKLEKRNEKYGKLKAEQEELFVALAERTLQVNSLKQQLGLEETTEDESGDGQNPPPEAL